jgi:hypothetical protein
MNNYLPTYQPALTILATMCLCSSSPSTNLLASGLILLQLHTFHTTEGIPRDREVFVVEDFGKRS